MALIRYAAVHVIRSRRRTITAMIGVLLAVTFVSGTFIAIDSSTRATLDAFLANLPSDINFEARATANGTLVREAVEAVPGVLRAAVIRFTGIGKIESSAASTPVSAQVIGVEPDRLPSALQGITVVSGNFSLPRGQVALSEDLAAKLNVSTGAIVTFRLSSFNPINQTEPGVNVTVGAIFTGVSPGGSVFTPLAVVHVDDAAWYEEQLGYQYLGDGLTGEIRIDQAQVLDPYDIQASRGNLARLERQIDSVLGQYGGHITADNVPDALSNFESALIVQRIFYLGLSAPVLLLGIYLGAVGIDLSHAERRRELAVLKTRGASRDQTLGLLVLEAAIGGVIAALIGLLAGVGLSRLLLSFVSLFSSAPTPQYELVVLSPVTVAIVAGLSVLFMAATSYRSARRTADLPIVETLRYYAPGETHIRYRAAWDALLVTLAVMTYGMVLYTQANQADFVTFLIGPLFIVLLPLAPIFLMVGLSRLLTRSTSKVYEVASRVNKPFAKNLHHVITRNLHRNPRRAANVAVIIALGLAFGMFTLVTFSSQFAYQAAQTRAEIGADIAIDTPPSDPSFAANVQALPEVAGLTVVQRVYVAPQFGYADLFALDPKTYLSITNPEPWYFRDFDREAVQQVLATPGQVLVTEAYLQSAYLAVGDVLTLTRSLRNQTGYLQTVVVNLIIGGTVRGLPGTSVVGSGVPLAIYGSYDTLAPLIDLAKSQNIDPVRYLVSLRQGADWRAAQEGIRLLGAGGIRVAQEEVDQLRSVPLYRAFFGFMELEIAFMVVILTAGLALILYAASLEREVELAAIRARGASGWQTAGLLVGEAWSIMLVALVVGAGVGVLSAYLSTTFVASGAGESLVPRFLIVPPESLLLLAAAPIAMLITSFLVSLRVARMDIGRVLKLRGG